MSDPTVKDLAIAPRFDSSADVKFTLAKLRECVGVFKESTSSDGTTIRFLHLLQGSKTGPMVRRFLQLLDNHIVAYAMHNRPEYNWPSTSFNLEIFQDAMRKAREKFRKGSKTGQLGEFIVFCLIEALLNAPQAVPKMYYKGENQMEVPGVDGIHAKWDASRNLLTLIWGESKIEKDVVAAVRNAFDSLQNLRTEGRDSEDWDLLTEHPNQLYVGLAERLKEWREKGPSSDFDVEHSYAVFVGYQDDGYATTYQKQGSSTEDLARAFLELYEKSHAELVKSCQGHYEKIPPPWSTIDVFFLPFPDVEDLRKKFEATLRGEPVSES